MVDRIVVRARFSCRHIGSKVLRARPPWPLGKLVANYLAFDPFRFSVRHKARTVWLVTDLGQ